MGNSKIGRLKLVKTIIRAEPGRLVFYHLDKRKKIAIAGKNLELLRQWLTTGVENELIIKLNNLGVIDALGFVEEKENVKKLLTQCGETGAPLRSLKAPELMNIELTTRCPLRCPQCYCDLNQGRDIKKETAFKYIEEAARLKIPYINLSGGETLVYPYLTELIEFINCKGLDSAIAISGWGFNREKLQALKKAGLNEIYVSLNGSKEKVNSLSRDGYEKAISALQILRADRGVNYFINWVARNDNVVDFPELVKLAQNYGVKGICILANKPDADYILQASLTAESFLFLADYLKKITDPKINIMVEPCYSSLRAYIYNYYFFNRNTGVDMGCGAGRNGVAVNVDGNLIPCRHLLYPENFAGIADYWWNSKILNRLRKFEDYKSEPCRSCYLTKNCLPCRAVGKKVYDNLFSGDHYCPVVNL